MACRLSKEVEGAAGTAAAAVRAALQALQECGEEAEGEVGDASYQFSCIHPLQMPTPAC